MARRFRLTAVLDSADGQLLSDLALDAGLPRTAMLRHVVREGLKVVLSNQFTPDKETNAHAQA